jgi:hypothetical protein
MEPSSLFRGTWEEPGCRPGHEALVVGRRVQPEPVTRVLEDLLPVAARRGKVQGQGLLILVHDIVDVEKKIQNANRPMTSNSSQPESGCQLDLGD